jgi:hypothetical protein
MNNASVCSRFFKPKKWLACGYISAYSPLNREVTCPETDPVLLAGVATVTIMMPAENRYREVES